MRMRDVLAVIGTHKLGDFPWGPTVIATVNPLLPANFRQMDLTMTGPQIEKMLLRLPATCWGTIQNTSIPDGDDDQDSMSQDAQDGTVDTSSTPPLPSPSQPVGSPPAPLQSDSGATPAPTPGPCTTDVINVERFKHVLMAVCFILTMWSLWMGWNMRKYNPTAVESKSIVVKILQQVADTIDSAATGQAPQIPSTPQQPLPANP